MGRRPSITQSDARRRLFSRWRWDPCVAFFSAALLCCFASVAVANDAKTILETAQAKQAERWATVDNYTVTLSLRTAGGMETPTYFEKMEVDGQVTFRMVPPPVYYGQLNDLAGLPAMSPEALEGYAEGLEMLNDAMAGGGGGEMPQMDMSGMTGQMSMFLMAGRERRIR